MHNATIAGRRRPIKAILWCVRASLVNAFRMLGSSGGTLICSAQKIRWDASDIFTRLVYAQQKGAGLFTTVMLRNS